MDARLRTRLVATLLVALGLALARPADAARRTRFNLLDPQVLASLPKPTRANARAMVRIGDDTGTGVMIDRAQGLILTNHHVALANPSTVRLDDGAIRPIREVVASNARYDYAVLRIGRTSAAQSGEARMRDGAIRAGEKVYAVSAVPGIIDRRLTSKGLHERDPDAFIAAHAGRIAPGPSGGRLLLRLAREVAAKGFNESFPTIQFGRDINKGMLRLVDRRAGTIWALRTNLPNAPGASGSPVFSADTHELVALHFAGGSRLPWTSSEIPLQQILRDLEHHALTSGNAATRTTLGAFLGRLHPAN